MSLIFSLGPKMTQDTPKEKMLERISRTFEDRFGLRRKEVVPESLAEVLVELSEGWKTEGIRKFEQAIAEWEKELKEKWKREGGSAPDPYERHSHTHCWNQGGNPPCGIPMEKHKQCCLCDLPAPDSLEEEFRKAFGKAHLIDDLVPFIREKVKEAEQRGYEEGWHDGMNLNKEIT